MAARNAPADWAAGLTSRKTAKHPGACGKRTAARTGESTGGGEDRGKGSEGWREVGGWDSWATNLSFDWFFRNVAG